jgi:outer membrane immunogenic protein
MSSLSRPKATGRLTCSIDEVRVSVIGRDGRRFSAQRAGYSAELLGDDMKKLLLGSAVLAVVATAGTALAADLAVKAPVYKAPPPVVEMWSWSGFYIGLNGGYSWGRSRTDVAFFNSVLGIPIVPGPGSVTSADIKLNGGVFGGQAGYNWQAGSFVAGIETDIQWSGQKGSFNFSCAADPLRAGANNSCVPATDIPRATGSTLSLEQKLLWFGTLRGRLGGLVAPSVLLYVTGGLAYGEIKTDATLSGFNANAALVSTALSNSVTKAGWTIGAGLEGRIAGNWTGKIEYLYMDLGTVSGTVFNTPAVMVGATYSSRITDNIIRVGVNYHFDSPVVARY